jgi:hypothetical protein
MAEGNGLKDSLEMTVGNEIVAIGGAEEGCKNGASNTRVWDMCCWGLV